MQRWYSFTPLTVVVLLAILAIPVRPAGAADAVATSQPTSQGDTAGLVAIDIKLPKPAFAGTPKNIPAGTTVEKAPDKPRPPFMAPPGTKNLAAGKKVTASDAAPVIGELTMVTNGDKEAADGSYVELGPGLQWVQIDLGAAAFIAAIVVWHSHGDPRVYHDVVVQACDDPDFIKDIVTLYNNDHDNSAGLGVGKDREYFETFEGRLMPGKGAKARYVRLYSKGCTADELNRYTEVEIFGQPAP